MKPILTIYQASNDTSVLYFEDEEDAQKYAGSAGVCAGINVCPVSLIQKSNEDLKPLDSITSKDLKWEFKPDYLDPKTRPEGYYRVTTSIRVKSIAYWNGDFWLCHGDEDEYCDFELFIETEKIERVEL